MDIQGKKVGIIGAAKSGIAAARVLHELGARVLLSDVQSVERLTPFLTAARVPAAIEIEGGGHSTKVLETDFIVLSPGVPLDIPILRQAAEKKIPILSEIELAYRLSRGKRLVITGSNGKTTTTTLLWEFCRTRFPEVFLGGNIGFPMIEFAGQTTPDAVQVLEVSSFQLETISTFCPDIAIITNFFPNHLDRYPSYDDYKKAKERIAMNMGPANWLILNADQFNGTEPLITGTTCRKAWFGWGLHGRLPGVTIREGNCLWMNEQGHETVLFPASAVKIIGNHNLENVMASAMGAIIGGVDPQRLAEVVAAFPGVEHRLEWVRERDGVKYINDSKGTNCAASIIALRACQAPVILIAGGRDKGTELGEWVSGIREKCKGVVLLGEARERFRAALEGIVPLRLAKDFSAAVAEAVSWAKSGDTVLLSPACSSYDMFPNFEVRGKAFKDLIQKL
jgi:UDP-N-acetylmuramoylalanine--D-glutamate ligase